MLPISTKEPARFTPPALEGKPDAPVFLLRVPVMRERISLDAAIAAEGVRYPTDGELAQALRDAIAEHVIEEQWPELLDIVEAFAAAADDGTAPTDEVAEKIEDIKRTLRQYHRPIAAIEAERGRFLATAMMVRAEMLLIGIEGENAPALARRAGRLTEECAEAIDERYGAGTLFAVGAHTISLTSPSRDDVKNSGSPPPSPPGPVTTKAAKPRRTGPNGKSSESDIPATLGSA